MSAKTQDDLEQWHSLWKKFCCNSLDESLPGMADGLSKATGQKISSLGSTSYLLALAYTPRFYWRDLSHFSFLSFFLPFFLFFNFFLFFLPFFLFFLFSLLKNAGGMLCYTALVFAPFHVARKDTLTDIHCGSFLKLRQRKATVSHPNS